VVEAEPDNDGMHIPWHAYRRLGEGVIVGSESKPGLNPGKRQKRPQGVFDELKGLIAHDMEPHLTVGPGRLEPAQRLAPQGFGEYSPLPGKGIERVQNARGQWLAG
jgi:hypothetical protein